MNISNEIAELLLNQEAVVLRPGEPFTFASGIRSPIYCDNRLLLTDPKVRKKVVEGYLQISKSFSFDSVGGIATAGIAWGAWLAHNLEKPFVYIRSAAKEHGKKNQIEGKLSKGAKVLLVEDLISTGGSVLNAADAVEQVGAKVSGIVSIFSYGFEEAEKNFQKKNYKVESIVTLPTMLKVALKLKKINAKEETLIKTWQKDPRSF